MYFCFRVPPILSDKRTVSHKGVSNPESSMGHTASIQPSRITSSAKSSRLAAVAPSNSRVHSSPSLRKGRQKNATNLTRQDLGGPSGQISEPEKAQINGVTNTLPCDITLSSEVIVSNSLKFVAQVICISVHYACCFNGNFLDEYRIAICS